MGTTGSVKADEAYDDSVGWVAVDGLLSAAQAARIANACDRALEQTDMEQRTGDKPHAGTRRLVDVTTRVPETEVVAEHPDLLACIRAILGPDYELTEAVYRSPQPGFGGQKLHADAVPKLGPGPNLCATAIVALVDFTTTNGVTRLVPGSNHRPDLQRRSANLDRHPDEVLLIGPAGTAFVFSGHVLHSGTENRSSAPRPALQLTFGSGLADRVGS